MGFYKSKNGKIFSDEQEYLTYEIEHYYDKDNTKNTTKVKCSNCDGKGYTDTYQEWYQDNMGSGYVTKYVDCKSCKGKGYK